VGVQAALAEYLTIGRTFVLRGMVAPETNGTTEKGQLVSHRSSDRNVICAGARTSTHESMTGICSTVIWSTTLAISASRQACDAPVVVRERDGLQARVHAEGAKDAANVIPDRLHAEVQLIRNLLGRAAMFEQA